MQKHLSIKNSFSRKAHTYQGNSSIQALIASRLLEYLDLNYIETLIDIGCGGGNLALQIQKAQIFVKDFIGIDISAQMLSQHPKKIQHIDNISLICDDFEKFAFEEYDVGIAASSLQWAKDIESLLENISKSCSKVAFGIHTNQSLSSVHNFLNTDSPLKSADFLKECLKKYFIGEMWLENFEQRFEDRVKFLSYLKSLGLLGGGVLDYNKAKIFRNEVPYKKVEYEVLMFIGRPL
ncbi:class I SAM-dependent methyltransferase [Helicobacter sp. 13S00477-4]|uniref:class I SAM-dependent methyltransferase n=1 Tax=Helicobacter sp. 13S00477-4 TaxID=1905759 RepID=UPI000BA5C67A|nr:class I SAM-dependent methyltransferase [Helicobacter sp. 13S00477-4]PAF50457.1 hypothetical protein BKH44_08305 [Helicobacter sp. 13S00477-4]